MRILARSAGPDFDCTSISVPPMKSMPKFSPWKKNSRIAAIDKIAEIGKLMRRKRMKSNLVSSGTIRSSGMEGCKRTRCPSYEIASRCGRVHRTHYATISRVSVKAVNTVVMMPMPSVTAKPRTGPVPMKNSTAAAMKVVMLESRMVASARAKPGDRSR